MTLLPLLLPLPRSRPPLAGRRGPRRSSLPSRSSGRGGVCRPCRSTFGPPRRSKEETAPRPRLPLPPWHLRPLPLLSLLLPLLLPPPAGGGTAPYLGTPFQPRLEGARSSPRTREKRRRQQQQQQRRTSEEEEEEAATTPFRPCRFFTRPTPLPTPRPGEART